MVALTGGESLAAKNLYEILEVAQNATPETIEAAYQSICARLRKRAERDAAGAAVLQSALDEAYRTLSNPDQRKRYDIKLVSRSIPIAPAVDDRPWLVRHAFALIILGVSLASGYGYHRHVQSERAAAEARLREQEVLLAKQKAERDEEERRQAANAQARQKRIEDAQYQLWVDKARREGTAHVRQQEAIKRRDEQDAARQQRMEDMAKQREEAQARARLEQEKYKLQRLEQQNMYGR